MNMERNEMIEFCASELTIVEAKTILQKVKLRLNPKLLLNPKQGVKPKKVYLYDTSLRTLIVLPDAIAASEKLKVSRQCIHSAIRRKSMVRRIFRVSHSNDFSKQ